MSAGIDISVHAIAAEFAGVPDAAIVYRRLVKNLHDDALEQLIGQVETEFNARKVLEVVPTPNCIRTLSALRCRFCIASNASRKHLISLIRSTGILPHVSANFFSGDDVDNKKPAPDIFLLAADVMGVSPKRCIVVEDSPSGIRAARAAGMRVVAFTGGNHYSPEMLAAIRAARPDFYVNDLERLADFI